METQSLPKDAVELKKFIVATISEVSDRIIPIVSYDEQDELNKLYEDSLYEENYDKKNCIRL